MQVYTPDNLKRSISENPNTLKKHASMMNIDKLNMFKQSRDDGRLYDESISVSSIHGRNNIVVRKGSDNNREDPKDRNNGYSHQKKL